MKKLIVIALATLLLAVSFHSAFARDDTGAGSATGTNTYQIFCRPFSINGFLMQEAAIGFDPKFSGKNVTDYSTLQLEWEYEISDKIQLYGINRLLGDLAYQIQSGKRWFEEANNTPAQSSKSRNNLAWEWNKNDREWEFFRELYLMIETKHVNFRLGRQQVVWGESDGLRLMDFINPQDLRREWVLRDSDEGYEYTRIPLWLIKATYFPGIEPFGIRDFQIEFIVNPGKPKQNRIELYESDGGVWAANEPNLPYLARVNVNDTHPKGIRQRFNEYAVRIMGNWNEWLFTLNFYYGTQPDVILKPKAPSLTIPPWDRASLTLNFDRDYGWRRIVGFTLNHEMGQIKIGQQPVPVLRVEALYELNKPFQYEGKKVGDMAWTGLNPKYGLDNYVRDKDQLRYMIGFDWPLYIRFLNPRESFFFSTQFFMYYIFGLDGQLVNAPFYFNEKASTKALPPLPGAYGDSRIDPWRIHKTQKYFSFLVNTQYDNKRIVPQFLFLYDFEEHGYAFKTKVNFNYGTHFRPEIGVMYIHGNHDTGKSFGLFQKNAQVYTRLKYQF
jgi:hypothetical protein